MKTFKLVRNDRGWIFRRTLLVSLALRFQEISLTPLPGSFAPAVEAVLETEER